MKTVLTLVFTLLSVGCGTETPVLLPDYTTERGILVFDPAGHTSSRDIDAMVYNTWLVAPDADKDSIFPAVDGLVLHIVDSKTVYCLGVDETDTIGCTDGQEIWVAWLKCIDRQPTAGTFAHEIGHLIGHHGHSYVPWFGFTTHGGPEAALDHNYCPQGDLTP